MSSPTCTIAAPPAPPQSRPAPVRPGQPARPAASTADLTAEPPASFGNALTRLYAGLVFLR